MRSITYDLVRLQMTDDQEFLHLRPRKGPKGLAVDFVKPAVARKGTDHDSTLVKQRARREKKPPSPTGPPLPWPERSWRLLLLDRVIANFVPKKALQPWAEAEICNANI